MFLLRPHLQEADHAGCLLEPLLACLELAQLALNEPAVVLLAVLPGTSQHRVSADDSKFVLLCGAHAPPQALSSVPSSAASSAPSTTAAAIKLTIERTRLSCSGHHGKHHQVRH